jgi:hypothetical protein
MLKAQFIRVYLETLFKEREKVMTSNVNINHCKSYYEIGIHMEKYGKDNLWKCRVSKDASKTGLPVKSVSFVYSCDTNDLEKAKTGLKDAIDFFFVVVKIQNMNPIGPLLLDYLKDSSLSLYKYLMKDEKHEDLVAEKITNDIDQHFSGSYTLHWNDSLNHWLVNYGIVLTLKFHVGYSSWINIPNHQRQLCYINYKVNDELPKWNIKQERY